jgi:hypothetical protein
MGGEDITDGSTPDADLQVEKTADADDSDADADD